jgi:hypothetical protein
VDKPLDKAKQAGVTPGRIILIGVLAIVLAAVLYSRFGPESGKGLPATASRSAARQRATKPGSATAKSAQAAALKKTGSVSVWQSPNLAAVVKYDPFALPAAFPQPRKAGDETDLAQNASQAQSASAQLAALEAERAKSEAELQALRQQGVQVIIENKNNKKQYVAVVGTEKVHVGDKIQGFTVIAIDANGVQVAKDLNP